jgi:hypothetical protein
MKAEKVKRNLEKGQRVISPDGEGEVIEIKGNKIKVRLNSGAVKEYPEDKLSDDSDAG